MILPHPQGIVIGAGVVVGPRAWIFQNVTIGGGPGKIGVPVIGADGRGSIAVPSWRGRSGLATTW